MIQSHQDKFQVFDVIFRNKLHLKEEKTISAKKHYLKAILKLI